MKRYGVVVPFTGTVYVEVAAKDAVDAIEKALRSEDLNLKKALSDGTLEVEFHKQIVKGNVLYASQNEAEVVDEFEEEDDE